MSRTCCALAALAVTVTTSANAQVPSGTKTLVVSDADIVVTARKREERLQETPIAITAIAAAQLDQRGAIDLTDVGPLAPNVIVRSGGLTSGTSSAAQVSIRGIGQPDFTINTEPAVGIYLDGVYLGRSLGSLLDLIDLERVEVLRGPQGVLFGRNTIGGAISLVSRAARPGEKSGTVSFTGGERGFRQVRGSLNLRLGERAALRLSGVSRRRGGYVDALQYENLKLGGEEFWGLRAALRLEPSDAVSIDFAVDYTERRDPPAAIVALDLGNLSATSTTSTDASAIFFNSGVGPRPLARVPFISASARRCETDPAFRDSSRNCFGAAWLAGTSGNNSVWFNRSGQRIVPQQKLDVFGLSINAAWDMGAATLKSISGYRRFKSIFYNDLDFTPFIIFHNNHEQPFEQEQLSQEFQLVGSAFGGRLDYVAGVYWFNETGQEHIDQLGAGVVPPPLAAAIAPGLPYYQTTARRIDNSSLAFFGQATLALTDRLKLSAGARWTRDRKHYEVELLRIAASVPTATGRQETKRWTPSATLAYQATRDLLAYASYSRGYRQGGFAARFVGGLPNPLPSFGPESVDSYELGVKASLFDRRVVFNAAVFRADYADIQVNATTPLLPGFTLNLASARLTGFEIEASAQLGAGFSVDGSVGYVDADLTDVAPGTVSFGGTNVAAAITAANQLPGPAWQVRGALAHTLALARGAIRSRIEYFYESADVFNVANNPQTRRGGFDLLNANIAYTPEHDSWSLMLGARNLLDQRYFNSISIAAAGSLQASVARPREVYAQVTFRFGTR